MKKKLFRVCLLLLTLGWMAIIFGFSAQSGQESGGLSAIIAQPITDVIVAASGGMSPEDEAALYQQVDGYVRVAAHFSEYAMLGMLLMLLCQALGLPWRWLPWLLGTIFAVTDEWHQSFSPGRVCDPMDVLIDSIGVCCGILLVHLFIKIWRKNHVHHP